MDELIVTYRVRASQEAIAERAEALLLEQTVELPRTALYDARVRTLAVGRVIALEAAGPTEFKVVLAQPAAAVGHDPAQLLNVLFGNSSLQPDIVLEDVALSADLLRHFGGPRFGIDGLRGITGVQGRALTATALKPMGLTVEQLADLAQRFALAGLDLIKDDHGLANQDFAPFELRVRACQAAVEDAAQQTGRRALYVPNLTGTPSQLRAQAELARQAGVRAVMVSPSLVGLPAFCELVRDQLEVPVLAHPAFGGAPGLAPVALLGRLYPIFGADAVIFPNFGGRFSYDPDTCHRLAAALRQPAAPLRPAFPVPAGGIRAERVREVLSCYGPDTVLLIGGSLLQEPSQIAERSRHFVEEVRTAACR